MEIAKAPSKNSAWADSVGRMKVQLHPYQAEGILFAAKKRRAFIADDMGLGKTVQAIGAALFLKELGAVKRVLVISPASLKFQWKQEIEKVSEASVDIIIGSAKLRDAQYKRSKAFFTLLNYELLYRDLDQILAFKPDMIILDEAQRIKNWETKIAQTIKRLNSPFRLVLTGTPMENRLPELLSISEFLNPRALGAPWNPAVLEQRIGRVYRMGQKKSVQAIHFISAKCVEQGIFALVAQKKALFSGVFSAEATEVRFTREQTASFVEKMKMLVPESAEEGDSDKDDPETELESAKPSEAEAQAVEPNAAGDSVAPVALEPSGNAGMEVDLTGLFRSLAGFIQGTQSTAAQNRPAEAAGMKLRLSQDEEGVHLTLPKQSLELLKGLAPLAAELAKLAGGAAS